MRRGLNSAGDGILLIKKKKKKNYPVGEKQDSWQGLAGQGTTRQGRNQETFDDKLAQDCKHKEIIKGANEEGNEGRQVG